MYCSDPNCSIRGPHIHNVSAENAEAVVETFRQQIQDFEKENASLRDAISDAWQTYNTCREALTEAQAQVQELATQNHMLSQYLIDTSEGFECLPGCNSNGHETMCPVSNPLVAWRLIRSQLQEVTSRLNQARAEVKELRRLIDDPDPTAV